MFKGTIAVCVLYSALALGLLLAILVSARARAILADYTVFTTTLILGSLVVMLLLVWTLLTQKVKVKSRMHNNLTCPDYWDLKPTPPAEVARMKPELRPFMKYKCVPSAAVFDNLHTPDMSDASPALAAYRTELDSAANTGVQPVLKCNEVYPDLMAIRDVDANKLPTTAMRCDYVDKCENRFAWSSVCPSS
jgi:hypothetical protein